MIKYLIFILVFLTISIVSCNLPTEVDKKYESNSPSDNSSTNTENNGSDGNLNQNNSFLTAEENEVIRLVNIERNKVGLKPLASFESLAKASDIRAKEICTFFSHTRPDGRTPDTVLSEASVPAYNAFGENISMGRTTPQAVVTAWMNSQGHRQNIMSSLYTHIGVGLYEENGVKHWVQLFYGKW